MAHEPTCACCGGASREDILAERDRMIAEYGYMIQQVLGDEDHGGFLYTIGLAQKGMPEFIFVGSARPEAANYVRGFVDETLAGREPAAGLHAPGTDANPFNVPAFLVAADDKIVSHAYGVTSQIGRVGGPADTRLLQVVMPDMLGRFPWEPGYKWLDQQVERPATAGQA